MKIKTSELTGLALNWAVAIAEGIPAEELFPQKLGRGSLYRRNRDEEGNLDGTYTTGPDLLFSRKWEAGGPIIEREWICLRKTGATMWRAFIGAQERFAEHHDTSPLTAAMRCYVASKLGDEVDIPEELV